MEILTKVFNAIENWQKKQDNMEFLEIFNEDVFEKIIDEEYVKNIRELIKEKNIKSLNYILCKIKEDIKSQERRKSLDYHLTKKVHYSETDYSVRYLIEEFGNQRMKMPKFQRSYVWEKLQVGEFILSLLRGIPIPKLYGYSEFDEELNKNVKLIIDGQQRLTSVLMWYYGVFPRYKIRKLNYSEHMTEIVKFCNYYHDSETYVKVANRLDSEQEREEMLEEIESAKKILEKKYKLDLEFEFKVKVINENNVSKEINISYRGEKSILSPKEKEDLLDNELGFVLVKGGKNSETVDIFRLYNSAGTPLSSQEIRNGIHYRNPLYKLINEFNDETGRIPGSNEVKNEKWNYIRNRVTDKSDVRQLFLMLACYFNLTYQKNSKGEYIKSDRLEKILYKKEEFEILNDKTEILIDSYSDFISENGNNKKLLDEEFSSIKNFFYVNFEDFSHTSKSFKNYIVFYIILRYLKKISSETKIPKKILEYKYDKSEDLSGYLTVKNLRRIYEMFVEEGVAKC